MARLLPLAILSAVAVLLWVSEISAQENEPPPPPSTEKAEDEKEANPGSQEVEYSEDNYRRFMELKDKNLQKSSLPTNKYQSGTQKLDELPESSQKHLRNQLREVIVEEGAWTPGDEDKQYPYVPSEAGGNNAGLRQKEAEAWQELVGEYHEREALIHANAARSDAAVAAAREGNLADGSDTRSGAGGQGGHEGGNKGSGGTGKQGMQTGQEQQDERDRNEGGYSPGSATQQGDPTAGRTAGVSENAMEFLMKNGGLQTGEEAGTNGTPSGSMTQGQKTAQAGQENSTGPTAAADSATTNTPAGQLPQKETSSKSTAGSSQNAMEFLAQQDSSETGNEANSGDTAADNRAQGEQSAQAAQENSTGQTAVAESATMNTPAGQPSQQEPSSQSTAGSSQNAMEYLTGSENQDNADATTSASPMDPDSEFEVLSKGTFPIRDLSNVKGVSGSAQSDIKIKEKEKRDDGPQ